MQDSHRQIIAIGAVLLFTLLQFIVLAVFGYTPYPDSEGYLYLANECLQKGDIYPVTSELNNYPFLWNIGTVNTVYASLKLFHSITPLLILYCIMKGITAWLFYKLTISITNKRTAFIALLLYLIYPANYGEATSVLSELPFTFFTMLGLWLCVSRKLYIIGGMALAVANWYRPMGIVILVALIIYLFVNKRRTIRPIIGYVAIILIIGSLNYLRTGLFLYQAKTGWMALADYSTQQSAESMQIRDNTKLNIAQKDAAWRTLFIDWLKDHPKEYFSQMPRKLADTYVSDNVNMCTFIPHKSQKEYMYEEVSLNTLINRFPAFSAVQWLTLWNLLFYYLLLITALLSLRFFRNNSSLLPLSIIILQTLLLLFMGHGESRFHTPIMPFVVMLSALFIANKYKHNMNE